MMIVEQNTRLRGLYMNIVKDGFQVRKIPKEEISGAIAPIYLMGLPGDLDKLEEAVKGVIQL